MGKVLWWGCFLFTGLNAAAVCQLVVVGNWWGAAFNSLSGLVCASACVVYFKRTFLTDTEGLS